MTLARDLVPGHTWLRMPGVDAGPVLVTAVDPDYPGGDFLCLTIDGERRLRRVHADQPMPVCDAPVFGEGLA